MACTSFNRRTCLTVPAAMPRNRQTRLSPGFTAKRLSQTPFSSTLTHGSQTA